MYSIFLHKFFKQSFLAGLYCIWVGDTPFHSKEFIMSGYLGDQLSFFHLFYTCTAHWEGFHIILTNSLHPYFKPACTTCLKQNFTCLSVACIQAAFGFKVLLTWVWNYIQIYTHACMHLFHKTISVNQVHAEGWL